MLPATVYTVEYTPWSTAPSYRIRKDGEELYHTDSVITGSASFVTADGTPAFSVLSWGLSDQRYGYAVRDADDDPIGWIADDVPFVGERLAIKTMDDTTVATLGSAGWLGKLLHEASRDLPFPAPAELALRTPEGHRVGTAKRRPGGNAYTVAVDDVGLDHRLLLAALVVANNRDTLDQFIARREASTR